MHPPVGLTLPRLAAYLAADGDGLDQRRGPTALSEPRTAALIFPRMAGLNEPRTAAMNEPRTAEGVSEASDMALSKAADGGGLE